MGGTLRMDIGGRSDRGQDANRAPPRHRAATESSLARQVAQSVGQRRVASAGGVVISWPGWLPRQVVLAEPLAHDVGDLAHDGERLDRAEDQRDDASPAPALSSL